MQALREVNAQIHEIKTGPAADNPYALRDERGNYVLAPLLAAKAQLLHGIAMHNQKG